MAAKSEMRFTITLTDFYDSDTVDRLVENGFLGLGHTYRLADPQVIYLRIRPDATYEGVIETLEELRLGGTLTYVEDENAPEQNK